MRERTTETMFLKEEKKKNVDKTANVRGGGGEGRERDRQTDRQRYCSVFLGKCQS